MGNLEQIRRIRNFRKVIVGKRGPSWRYSYTGGKSARFAQRQTANLGLQGLQGFAPEQVCTLGANAGIQFTPFGPFLWPTRRAGHAEINRQICRITCGE